MKVIYVVEDHEVIREGVKKYLEMEQYIVLSFADLASAREAIDKKRPNLLIQDVMLPDGDGFDFVEEINRKYHIPVIFMTAKVGEEDRIKGLELGADDYITKPFSLKELVLRVNAIFRRIDGRTTQDKKTQTTFKTETSQMVLNNVNHKITIDDKSVVLTSAEWKLLYIFTQNWGQLVSRQTIIKDCFGYDSEIYSRIADTHVKNLRAKIGSHWIITERGAGYRFVGILQ